MTFILVVDDFGIKFVGLENSVHLLQALENYYKIETAWIGSCYIDINWIGITIIISST